MDIMPTMSKALWVCVTPVCLPPPTNPDNSTTAMPTWKKRDSRYLRFAIYNATKYVCLWDPTFVAYLAKKRAEGKHYNVALSHAAKKLVRLIYAMEKSGLSYQPVAAV